MSIEEGLIEGSTLRGEDGGQGGYVVLLFQCLGQLKGLLHIEEEAEGRGEAQACVGLGKRWCPVSIHVVIIYANGWYSEEHELYIDHHRGPLACHSNGPDTSFGKAAHQEGSAGRVPHL